MSVEVKVPAMGESVTEVFVGDWFKDEGDEVAADERLVELESEKATFDLPAPTAGVIDKILKRRGDKAEVGEVIAHIDDAAARGGKRGRDSGKRVSAETKDGGAVAPPRSKEVAAPTSKTARPKSDALPRVMPSARRALDEHGLSAEDVEPTGPGGRLLKEDVLRHVAGEKASPERREDGAVPEEIPGGREEEVVPMSPIRRIAERLVRAQQNAALLTTFNEIDMSAVIELRTRYREAFQSKYGIKLGFMSFFVKAAIEALKEVPQVNAEVRGSDVVYRNHYDIGIAVGGGKGLVVPVLRNAESMGFAQFEQTIDDLSRRAKANKLAIHELEGGTFTISNGGIYGSLLSTPIVNPPQSGVLGMHAIQDRPVVRGGEIVARPMMYVALTYDHRIIDGRDAVTFLKRIKETVEEPARILIEV